MVDKYSTRAPPKDTEERMVFHMSCDTTQHRALETTHCVGRLMNCKQTSRGRESYHESSHKLPCASQREPSHCYSFQLGSICGAALCARG